MNPDLIAPVGAASSMTTTGTQLAERPYFIPNPQCGKLWLGKMRGSQIANFDRHAPQTDQFAPATSHKTANNAERHEQVRFFIIWGSSGADRGNRTLLGSLEGYCITTMLCPQIRSGNVYTLCPTYTASPHMLFAPPQLALCDNNLQQALDFSAATYFVPAPVMAARLWLVRRAGFRYRSFPAVADTLQGCSSIG